MSSALAQLKSDLQLKHGMKLIDAQNLKCSAGVSTGWSALDSFVASGGFPCGEISLLEASEGLGAVTLWLEAAAKLTANQSRVAWLNSALDDREPFQLHPPAAFHRGVDLQKLFLVDVPTAKQRLWILQELLNSKLFSLVGCDLGEVRIPLRECRSLLMQARRSGAAVVLFDRRSNKTTAGLSRSGSACAGLGSPPQGAPASCTSASASGFPPAARSLASLVLKFESSGVEIIRAAHRPVPHCLTTQQRRDRHVDFITLDPSFILTSGTSAT